MPFPFALDDLVEVKLYCHSEGQYSINSLHYAVSDIEGLSSTDALAAVEFGDKFGLSMRGLMSENAQYMGCTVQILSPTRRPKEFSGIASGVGAVEGDILPRQICGLIRKRTALAAKTARGRLYVPFPPESANSALGFPTGPYVADLASLALLLDDLVEVGGGGNTATLTPVVLSRETATGQQITSTLAMTTWATQRRRADVRGGDRSPF